MCRGILFGLVWMLFTASGMARSGGLPMAQDQREPPRSMPLGVRASDAEHGLAGAGPMVRMAYLIPPGRVAQPRAVETLRYAVVAWQSWYREQMLQHGLGPRTFVYETEADGVTPRVHVVGVAQSDAYLRGDIWGRVSDAASGAGITVWAAGEVWLLVPEIHVQNSDGSIDGGVALGGSWGSGTDGGVAMIGSNALAVMRPAFLRDDRAYGGMVIEELGEYPLVDSVSFAWFEGTTLSELHSTYLGAALHELSHGFGLPHDMRNDANFRGNLMGNGLRGIRGSFLPGAYAQHFTRLSRGNALAVHTSRYFNRESAESAKPQLVTRVAEAGIGTGNRLEIPVVCSDIAGLGSLHLGFKGERVECLLLTGNVYNGVVSTAFYEPGVSGDYSLQLYDASGNRTDREFTLIGPQTSNRPPRAVLKASPQVATWGTVVRLDPRETSDPDDSLSALRFEYDYDGDGIYDTEPLTSLLHSFRPERPGCYLIGMRVTDGRGGEGFSVPVPVLVHAPELRVETEDTGRSLWWEARLGFGYRLQHAGEWAQWVDATAEPVMGTGLAEMWMLDTSGPWLAPGRGFFRVTAGLAE